MKSKPEETVERIRAMSSFIGEIQSQDKTSI